MALSVTGCGTDHDHDDPSALFEAAYEEANDGKTDVAGCSGVKVPDRNGFNRRIALTFDDGPKLSTTPRVMEILAAHNAPATFFINSMRVGGPSERALIREMHANPLFTVASHSVSHKNIPTLEMAEAIGEIEGVNDLLSSLDIPVAYFRFPFGAANCELTSAVRERGMTVTGWHVDTADWCFAANDGTCPEEKFRHVPDEFREDMAGLTLQQARAWNGGILLYHDIHGFTADSLDGILTLLEDEGFTFTSLDDVETFPLLNGIEPVREGFIGDKCDVDEDCKFSEGFCLHDDSINDGYCTKACTGSCPDKGGYPSTRCVDAPAADDESIRVCAIECGDGCREGYDCSQLSMGGGLERNVCW